MMSVAGFHDALADAVPVWVNDSLLVPVVSPAGLLLLKLLAWNERRNQKPGRDASDIAYVCRHAVKLISEHRLFEEHLSVVVGSDTTSILQPHTPWVAKSARSLRRKRRSDC